MSSFQRQLNYFGFRKWTKTQSCVCTFSHADFNRSSSLESVLIARKKEYISFDTYMEQACDSLIFDKEILLDDAFDSTDEECANIDIISHDELDLDMDLIHITPIYIMDWFKAEPLFEWDIPLLT
jgi:hypothetical protein